MSEGYQIVDRADSPSPLDPKKLAEVLAKEGQFLLPIVNLIENAQAAIDDLIDVMGRATIEAVLLIERRAGRRTQAARKENRAQRRLSRLAEGTRRSQGASTPRQQAETPQTRAGTGRVRQGRSPGL